MEHACQMIQQQESIHAVNGQIAPLSEVFRLQNAQELADAEAPLFTLCSEHKHIKAPRFAVIDAEQFISELRNGRHTFVSGVPCSYLTPLINRVIDCPHLDYLPASSEGEAIGINLGAYLYGRKTVTLCQNSGLR